MTVYQQPPSWGEVALTGKTGSTYQLGLTYKVNGVAFDLTGWSATMTFTPNTGSTITLTNGNGIVLGGALGTFQITLSATQTTNLGNRSCRVLLNIAKDGVVKTVVDGSLDLE